MDRLTPELRSLVFSFMPDPPNVCNLRLVDKTLATAGKPFLASDWSSANVSLPS